MGSFPKAVLLFSGEFGGFLRLVKIAGAVAAAGEGHYTAAMKQKTVRR